MGACLFKKARDFSGQTPSRKEETRAAFAIVQEGFKLKDIIALIGLPEATYHYHVKRLYQENPDSFWEDLITKVFYDKNERAGYRGIQDILVNLGHKINHKKVQRIMQKLGLKCLKFSRKSRQYNSYKGTVGKVASNRINRRFVTPYPLQKLLTDITEMKCQNNKKLYLSPILDLYNSEIISFSISDSPNVTFAMESLQDAMTIITKHAVYRTTIHSDQGFHYQNQRWVNTLKANKVFQSMSRKGNCLDNAPMESFFGILKQEMYYGEHLKSYEDLKKDIESYIADYNQSRLKRKLNRQSPVTFRENQGYSYAA
ncbi:IS3 family transposase [Alkalibacterium gilvum]|uniref:IS3 family transposase n=1 Tax=Alkalibacterium gilvum TaxID=1130080 RepID=UPI003F93C2E1